MHKSRTTISDLLEKRLLWQYHLLFQQLEQLKLIQTSALIDKDGGTGCNPATPCENRRMRFLKPSGHRPASALDTIQIKAKTSPHPA